MLKRSVLVAAMVGALATAAPAPAQFFLRNPDLSGPPMRGNEPELGYALPGATPAEQRAGVVWSMRAALNVAALQCQFEPTLMMVDNYNAILIDHKAELSQTLDTLGKYFTRVNKTKARGTTAFDQFGTRLYSGFSTVTAQYVFCLTAAQIARDAVFAPRGKFGDLAIARLSELRKSLKPAGEQQFPARGPITYAASPMITNPCWIRPNKWDTRLCGKKPN